MFRFTLAVAILLVTAAPSLAKKTEVKSSVRFLVCASNTTLVTEKGVCYVYDIVEKKQYLEVTVAGGVVASAGTIVFGGEAKAVIEVTLQFPLGTSEKEAVKIAEAELAKEIKKQKVKEEASKVVEEDISKILKPEEVQVCKEGDDVFKALENIFKDAPKKKKDD